MPEDLEHAVDGAPAPAPGEEVPGTTAAESSPSPGSQAVRAVAPMRNLYTAALSYNGYTITDGALRLIVLLHAADLGYVKNVHQMRFEIVLCVKTAVAHRSLAHASAGLVARLPHAPKRGACGDAATVYMTCVDKCVCGRIVCVCSVCRFNAIEIAFMFSAYEVGVHERVVTDVALGWYKTVPRRILTPHRHLLFKQRCWVGDDARCLTLS